MSGQIPKDIGLEFPARFDLRGGIPVILRPVRPEDKHLFETAMENLSPRARYFRFFHPVSQLSNESLRRFTEIDHCDHEAIGALDVSGPVEKPVGTARYIRIPEDRACAEVAVTIIDSHQGLGLGTLLLAVLAGLAIRNGIREFKAVVLSENSRMLEVFRDLGATIERAGGGEMDIGLPLHADAACYPDTPAGAVFRKALSGESR